MLAWQKPARKDHPYARAWRTLRPVPSSHRTLAAALALFACGPDPETLPRQVEAQLQSRDFAAIARQIDEAYGDPLGDRATLLEDLAALDRDFPRWSIDWTSSGLFVEGTALVATVQTRIEAELVGKPTWKVEGPMPLALHRSDRWRVRGGLLTDLRDIRGLMRQRRRALEANDVDGLAALLHPHYRDGLIDRKEAVARLRRDVEGLSIRLRATNYRLEVRADLAHVDEYYILTVGEQIRPPAAAGFTLRKSAGRWRIAAGLYASP